MQAAMPILDTAPGPTNEALDRMLGCLLKQRRALREMSDRYDELVASMPWWARPGKRLLGVAPDGRPFLTGHCWEPAITSVTACPGELVLIRPSDLDIHALVEYRREAWGKAGADRARALYRQDMLALEHRRAAARAERERCGSETLAPMVDDATKATTDLQDQILALPASPERAALQILFDAIESVEPSQSLDSEELARSVAVLHVLRPLVAGRTAALVNEYLKDTARPLADSPLSCTSWAELQRCLTRESDTFDIPHGLLAAVVLAA